MNGTGRVIARRYHVSELRMAISDLSFRFARCRLRNNPALLRERRWMIKAIVLAGCSLWLFACVQLLPTRKSESSTSGAGVDRGWLVKPRLQESSNGLPVSPLPTIKEEEEKRVSDTRKSPWLLGSLHHAIFSKLPFLASSDKPGSHSKLIKPRLDESIQEEPLREERDADLKEKQSAETVIRTERASNNRINDHSSRDSLDSKRSSSIKGKSTSEKIGLTDPRIAPEDEKKHVSGSSAVGTDKSQGPESMNSKITGPDESQTTFKKHDHSKYVSTIRNKAIDKVNQEKNSDYVRVCKDANTDEWSLTFYYRQRQSYYYVTFIWDEIDDKWQESFVSEKRSMSGWKHHLTFSSAGKNCKVLKGSQEP